MNRISIAKNVVLTAVLAEDSTGGEGEVQRVLQSDNGMTKDVRK